MERIEVGRYPMAELVIEIKKLKDKMVNRLLILIFIVFSLYVL